MDDKSADKYWMEVHRWIRKGEIALAEECCKKEPHASNSVYCQRFLGWNYYESDDFEQALSWFARAVDRGDAESMYGVACVYFNKKEFVAAFDAYRNALTHGYFRACYWIGYMYEKGLGVERDINNALSYYERGSSQGYLISIRAYIHLIFQYGSFFQKLKTMPTMLALLIKGFVIAHRDINDERLADVPNAFDRGHFPRNPRS